MKLYHYLNRFVEYRANVDDRIHLNIGNIYVFISRAGILFFIQIVVGFVVGTNYASNLILGLCFYLLSISLLGALVSFNQLSKLSVHLNHVTLAPADNIAWVNLTIYTKQKCARQIELYFEHNQSAMPNDIDLTNFYAKQHQTIARIHDSTTISLPIITNKRGAMQLPRLVIRCRYPLGVIQSWSYARFAKTAWVYPKPISFDLNYNQNAHNDNAKLSNHYHQGQNDFDRLDNYIEGESLARVSWSHVARGMGMLSKRFVDSAGNHWQLNYHDMPASQHEDKLGQLCYAVLQLQNSGMPFSLNLPNHQIPLGAGDDFIKNCLLQLAKAP